MTTIYHYHPTNYEYLGESTAQLDPLDKKPMIPAHATIQPPPKIKKNQVATFTKIDNVWKVVVDFRNTVYWLEDNTEHTIKNIGIEIPKDALLSEPQPDEKEKQQSLALQARKKRDELMRQSDYTMMPDYQLSNKGEWVEYRQKLRDITTQSNFPMSIEWPKIPNNK